MQLVHRAIAHKSKLDNTRIDYADNLNSIKEAEHDLEILSDLLKNLEYGHTYLERLINAESERFIKRLEGLISYGLDVIFFDEDYSCEIRVTDKNQATIHLITTDDEGNPISPDIRGGVGGGVKTVVGIIMQIFYIFYTSSEPILFVDEGFSQLSDIYIPYLMAFLKEMFDLKGLRIVLITHDERLIPYADKVYRVEKGRSYLIKKGSKKDNEESSAVAN